MLSKWWRCCPIWQQLWLVEGKVFPEDCCCLDIVFSDTTFLPNELWFLNRFCSGFLETWYLKNQPAFPPILSRAIIIKDASSAEGAAQCTKNSSSKMADCIDYLQVFDLQTSMSQLLMRPLTHFHPMISHLTSPGLSFQLVVYDTPTDVVRVRTSGQGKQLGTNFSNF